MARECEEEVGYKLKPIRLISKKEMTNPETRNKYLKYFYAAEITGGAPLEKRVFGVVSPKWFPLAKLQRNMFRSHADIVHEYVTAIVSEQLRGRHVNYRMSGEAFERLTSGFFRKM